MLLTSGEIRVRMPRDLDAGNPIESDEVLDLMASTVTAIIKKHLEAARLEIDEVGSEYYNAIIPTTLVVASEED